MSALGWTLLSNTLVAGVIAAIGVIVWRRRQHVALAHALMVLATLKLVTPALFVHGVDVGVPLGMPNEVASAGALEFPAEPLPAAGEESEQNLVLMLRSTGVPDAGAPEYGAAVDRVSSGWASDDRSVRGAVEAVTPLPADAASSGAPTLAAAAIGYWLWPALMLAVGAGALMIAGFAVCRGRRVDALLRHAPHGDAQIQAMTRVLCRDLGLRRIPAVRVVAARVSPFAFSWRGRTTVVLPQCLLDRLDRRAVRAILAHELCHIAGGDHWTRRLECLVVAVHWWNPVAHWVRRWLRHLEEVRCDARAVTLLNGIDGRGAGATRRAYGRALLQATSHLQGDLAGLPLTASGLGGTESLKSRLMLMTANMKESRLSCWSRLSLAPIALALLPIGVGAQDPAPAAKSAKEAKGAKARGGDSREAQEAREVTRELRALRDRIDALLGERGEESAKRSSEAQLPTTTDVVTETVRGKLRVIEPAAGVEVITEDITGDAFAPGRKDAIENVRIRLRRDGDESGQWIVVEPDRDGGVFRVETLPKAEGPRGLIHRLGDGESDRARAWVVPGSGAVKGWVMERRAGNEDSFEFPAKTNVEVKGIGGRVLRASEGEGGGVFSIRKKAWPSSGKRAMWFSGSGAKERGAEVEGSADRLRAVFEEQDLPGEWRVLTQVNEDFFGDSAGAEDAQDRRESLFIKGNRASAGPVGVAELQRQIQELEAQIEQMRQRLGDLGGKGEVQRPALGGVIERREIR